MSSYLLYQELQRHLDSGISGISLPALSLSKGHAGHAAIEPRALEPQITPITQMDPRLRRHSARRSDRATAKPPSPSGHVSEWKSGSGKLSG